MLDFESLFLKSFYEWMTDQKIILWMDELSYALQVSVEILHKLSIRKFIKLFPF